MTETQKNYRNKMINIPIINEWDRDELTNIIKNYDTKGKSLIFTAIVGGAGKSDAFKHAFKYNKHEFFVITPNNKLACDFKKDGFEYVYTANILLKVGINHTIIREMKDIDVSHCKYMLFDEVYCYDMSMLNFIIYFMKRHKNIRFYATGDPFQLPPVGVNLKEYNHTCNNLNVMFPYNVHLNENKRIKDPKQRQRIYDLKNEIFDMSYELNEARIKQIFRDFPSVNFEDIGLETDKVILYTHEKQAQINYRFNELRGGMKIGDYIVCCKRLQFKKQLDKNKKPILCFPNAEYKIIEITFDKDKDKYTYKLEDELTKVEFYICCSTFGSHFRLNYAYCVHSCQGLSFEGNIVIADVLFKHVDRSFLWVAITRARDLDKIRICYNTYDNDVYVKNIWQKIKGYKQQDIDRKLPTYDTKQFNDKDDKLEKYVNPKWVYTQLEKQNYRCLSCHCLLELNYESGSLQQWTINRINNDLPHLEKNCNLLCLLCNISMKDDKDKQASLPIII